MTLLRLVIGKSFASRRRKSYFHQRELKQSYLNKKSPLLFSCQRLNEKQRRKTNIKITQLRVGSHLNHYSHKPHCALFIDSISVPCTSWFLSNAFVLFPDKFYCRNVFVYIAETSSDKQRASIHKISKYLDSSRALHCSRCEWYEFQQEKIITATRARLKRGSKDLIRLIEVLWCMKLVNNHMRGSASTFEWSTIRWMKELKPFWRDGNEL